MEAYISLSFDIVGAFERKLLDRFQTRLPVTLIDQSAADRIKLLAIHCDIEQFEL
ncbi:hypothetical protein K492DRAFT_173653, partial [Lichtheimia hyalospora FSU 10163]